ncbi:MAG: nucleoside monophosphate kinase [Bdellovibrionota bacterium]
MVKIPVIVLLGPPGSGKGTQAKELQDSYPGWVHVSTGNLFRAEIASGSTLGLSVKDILTRGELVSDEVTNKVFESQVLKILDTAKVDALVLDGYPRTRAQAEYLMGMTLRHTRLGRPVPVELKVSEAEVVSRLAGRWINPRTGRVYHERLNPPKTPRICDDDGQPLVQRSDDKPDVIRSRYKLYVEQRDGIVEGLQADDRLVGIQGEGPLDQVSVRLEKVVADLQKGV